ncbi:MAG: hypothetical protein ACT6FG_00475 [Methanosarcinaceae archaeon]
MTKIRVISSIEEEDVIRMDMKIKDGTYASRSHFMRQAAKELIDKINKK